MISQTYLTVLDVAEVIRKWKHLDISDAEAVKQIRQILEQGEGQR